MSKISQVSVDPCVIFFKKGLMDKWSLTEYYDINSPCLFFGVSNQINLINQHKGLKIVHFISPSDCKSSFFLEKKDLFFFHDPHLDKDIGVNTKDILIEFKDFSIFRPNPLGDKIYCYAPMRADCDILFDINHSVEADGWGRISVMQVINRIQEKINFEILYDGGGSIQNYKSIELVKESYYDKCFLNLNLGGDGGMTTVRELAYMGRKTICNSLYKFPSFISYLDEDDIIRIINEESKKIGTIQPSIISHNINDEWLYTDFWIN